MNMEDDKQNTAIGFKNRISQFKKKVSEYCVDFINNSSIQGLKYLIESETTIIEKNLWLLLLSICIYTCYTLVGSTWIIWEENPVVIGISHKSVNVREIPFPAVTICAGYPYSNSVKMNALLINGSTTYEEPLLSQTLLASRTAIDIIHSFGKLSNWTTDFSFEKLFSPVLSQMGICFSFNMLDKSAIFRNTVYFPQESFKNNISNWNFDDDYLKTDDPVFPFRLNSILDAFLLQLKRIMENENYVTLRMTLHHPADVPALIAFFPLIDIDSDANYEIFIKPDIMLAAEALKSYTQHRKKCYFSNDRYLYFFNIYTVKNCKLECIANYTLQECKCVPFYLPHTIKTPICSNVQVECVATILDKLFYYTSNGSLMDSCNCLPLCHSITYNYELKILPISEKSKAYIQLKYQDSEFQALQRQEVFGDNNFYANCGGLIGLCTGFSMVSLAEIIYYVFIRWMCRWAKKLCPKFKNII